MINFRNRRAWTCGDLKKLREHAGRLSGPAIARMLNRSYYSVRLKACREGLSLTHAYDDIQVGRIVLPYVPERYGWMKPDGKVTRNPLIAQRVAEELNERAKRCA